VGVENLEMSEFCDSAWAEFCAELAVMQNLRSCTGSVKIMQILFYNIALSSEYFGVKVIK